MDFKYCNDLFSYQRFLTREVNIGGIPLGALNPVRIQTMTNTNTLDTSATVEQCIRVANAGADYVRITTQGKREVQNLAEIKAQLRKRGFNIPLVADVHFNAELAELAAEIVEKVRINPGNYSEKRRLEKVDFTEKEYKEELDATFKKLIRLFKICRRNATALRIGVNHGSLSDRIMSRYGDTPDGMVESAMEFLRFCSGESFHNVTVSLKSSNTRIMIQSNRLLVNKMIAEGMNYPVHLGVTEAGEGESGRIKSSSGIGSLLADGIGDTIRVSLTGDPEDEIPVAKKLVNYFLNRRDSDKIHKVQGIQINPFSYNKRESTAVEEIGGKNFPVVVSDWDWGAKVEDIKDTRPEYFFLQTANNFKSLPRTFRYILNMNDWFKFTRNSKNIFPLYTEAQFNIYGAKHPVLNFVIVSSSDDFERLIRKSKDYKNVVLILETFNSNGVADQRSLILILIREKILTPVIINRNYAEDTLESFQIKAACDVAPLIADGFIDGLWLRNGAGLNAEGIISTSFDILQAGRVRTTKTEYISCPSCGRTLFDLQTVTSGIKRRTMHLKNLKIAVMGCIVNGPGEMADADYGYVGAGIGKITLYKGKEIVKKNVSSEEAIDELVQLIKDSGDWLEEE